MTVAEFLLGVPDDPQEAWNHLRWDIDMHLAVAQWHTREFADPAPGGRRVCVVPVGAVFAAAREHLQSGRLTEPMARVVAHLVRTGAREARIRWERAGASCRVVGIAPLPAGEGAA